MEEFKGMSGNPKLTEESCVMVCRTDRRNEKNNGRPRKDWTADPDLWIGRRVQHNTTAVHGKEVIQWPPNEGEMSKACVVKFSLFSTPKVGRAPVDHT